MELKQRARRLLALRGYLLHDEALWVVTNDDDDRGLEETLILHWSEDDPVGAYLEMMARGFPREEGPCELCNKQVDRLRV